jgi:serine/threonine-protein kinase
MDTERWQLVGDIFERLLGAPQPQRSALLDTLCGEDNELKKIVVSMLDSEASARGFDEKVAARQGTDESGATAVADEATEPDAALTDTRIGPWRLVRKIGSGGMGIVWLAERADGQFRQRAALKLIKRGMDSDAVLARFLRERQILARLEHPNIAHLLDGGITADGRPYFAMEYVEGLPLLDFCRGKSIRLEERIKLFLDICAAVQFAHERHVVHRDIKPSNVLITANGSVKLLDFGIAKLLQDEDELVATLTSAQRDRPMTPAYAAPEQISGEAISEATDVYALGGVLYELLTDRRAHDFSGANDANDVLRIIQATDPVAPSRLKLVPTPVPRGRLRGDLDVIVLTALRHQPARRYASAVDLAADLQNYLAGKPIAARRDHVIYRSYKFLRRHRSGVGVALIALAAATLVLVDRQSRPFVGANASLAIVDFNNLAHNKDAAWIAPALARMFDTELAEGSSLHALPDELVRSASADLPAPLAGGYAAENLAVLRKRLAADFVLSGGYFVSGTEGEASLRLDLALQDAKSGQTVANVARTGALAELPSLITTAAAELRGKLGLAATVPALQQQIRKAQPPNTDVARSMGSALDALRRYEPARAKDELLAAVAVAPGYAPAYLYLAQAWKAMGYDSKALAMAQQAAANGAALPAGLRLKIERQLAALKAEWTKAVELDRSSIAQDPSNAELRFDLADDLLAAGKPADAEIALAELRKLPGAEDDPRTELRASRLATIRGDPAAQAQFAERALQLAQSRDEQALVARAKQALGDARDLLGERAAAETLVRQAIAGYQQVGNPSNEAEARWLLALILGELGKPQEQSDEFQRALEIYKRIGNQAGTANIYVNLGWVLGKHGDYDSAETASRNALNIFRETGDLKGQAQALSKLANLALEQAASDEAVTQLREAMDLSQRIGQPLLHLDVLRDFVWAMRQRGELGEAQAACIKLYAELKQVSNPFAAQFGEYECAVTALERGDVEVAEAGFSRAQEVAMKTNSAAALAIVDVQLARIDMSRRNWPAAHDRLLRAIDKYAGEELTGYEAVAQSLLALTAQRLDNIAERDRAAARARELGSRVTARQKVLVAEIALAQLDGEIGSADSALLNLKRLADEATKRRWLADALYARLAMVELLAGAHDPRTTSERSALRAEARQHGFDWLLARLQAL